MTPSRDEVLAAATPEALFGEAVGDPLALRRAYAALLKAFPDDAQVFGHVRALYERVRDGGEAPTPEAQELDPVAELLRAVTERRGAAAALLFHAHADRLVREGGPLFERALRLIVLDTGGERSEVDLDMVSAVIGRPDLPASPQLVGVIERAVAALRAIHRAERDPRVPPALIAAVRSAWSQPPRVAAEVWLDLAGKLAEVDLDALCAVLERDHPAVLGVMCRVELRIASASASAAPPELAELRARVAPSTSPAEHLLDGTWAQTLSFSAVFVVSRLILLLFSGSSAFATAGAFVAAIVVTPILRRWLARRLSVPSPASPASELVAAARAHALWPRELALALAPARPIPIQQRYAYVVDHPLVVWEQDAAATLRVITASHVARVPRD